MAVQSTVNSVHKATVIILWSPHFPPTFSWSIPFVIAQVETT